MNANALNINTDIANAKADSRKAKAILRKARALALQLDSLKVEAGRLMSQAHSRRSEYSPLISEVPVAVYKAKEDTAIAEMVIGRIGDRADRLVVDADCYL